MIVGLTYDLQQAYLAQGYSREQVAELDQPETVDALAVAIERAGHDCRRIGHVRSLASALLAGQRWDLVFNIAEGIHGMGREALVPALLDHHRIPYTFSDPLTLALALHKGKAKAILRDANIATPAFAVVESPDELGTVDLPPYPLFVKPVAEGTSRGIGPESIVRNELDLARVCRSLTSELRQPVVVEEYLPGRELTVTVLGTGHRATALGTLEVTLHGTAEPGVYSYFNKANYEGRVSYSAPRPTEDPVAAEAERLAVLAWQALGGRDAGRVDLRCDHAGSPQVIEINPLAGLHPVHSDVPILCRLRGLSYDWLIEQILTSASERIERSALVA